MWASNYTTVFLLKKNIIKNKNWITPSRKRSFCIMQERDERCICILPQSLKLLHVPKILESDPVPKFDLFIYLFFSLSFASPLITIQNPPRIYRYLDHFLLKFLFISNASEWVLTLRLSPMTLAIHSLNVKEYISLISWVLTHTAWVPTVSQKLIIFRVLILRRSRCSCWFCFYQHKVTMDKKLLTAARELCLT